MIRVLKLLGDTLLQRVNLIKNMIKLDNEKFPLILRSKTIHYLIPFAMIFIFTANYIR